MSSPQVLFITSEIYPFSKTGGLGDVLGALPLQLHRMGVDTAVITPFYGRLQTSGIGMHLMYSDLPVGYPWTPVTADVYQADFRGMPVYLVARDEFFDRRSYYNTHKGDYFDNCERFIFFNRAVMQLVRTFETAPTVVHAHDWQAALTPAYLNFQRQADPFWAGTRSVMTIHNLAFQGRFSSRLFWQTGLPPHAWSMDGAEFHGDFNMLKTGIAYADHVTTVSPSYAEEICCETCGCGLEGILSKRGTDVTGILNGADYEVWDPAYDRFLPCTYSPDIVAGKHGCKASLLRELGLDADLAKRPVLGFIGRLREQKGIDLLIEIIPDLVELDVGLVILGEGDPRFEAQVLNLMEEYPGRVAANVAYTEDLAHRIQAGTDIFLMPSRYEPCGLTQMYSLRFGTPPVATAVGGLRDTIVPYPSSDATGFMFPAPESRLFLNAVREAVTLWEDDPAGWQAMRDRAMRQDFSWRKAGEEYLAMYRSLGADITLSPREEQVD